MRNARKSFLSVHLRLLQEIYKPRAGAIFPQILIRIRAESSTCTQKLAVVPKKESCETDV